MKIKKLVPKCSGCGIVVGQGDFCRICRRSFCARCVVIEADMGIFSRLHRWREHLKVRSA